MRSWLCVVLVACAGNAEPGPPRLAPPTRTARGAAPATPSVKLPRPPPTGAHGAEIAALAVTADGTAVATADRLGGIRLWTALDGTREPVVIHGTAPRALAVIRDGHGFTVGALDAAGGVHVMRTSAAGALRDRVTVANDQPATEIESTSEGLLILRADQTIELVGSDGAIRARLTPEPGTRIDSLVAQGDHVLALVREDNHLHGRWIAVDHGVRWGAATPRLAIQIAHAVLSPDGALLAVSRPRSLHPVLIDLATGVARKVPLCVPAGWPQEGGERVDETELLRGTNPPAPLGFLSPTVVACSVISALVWWDIAGKQIDTAVGGLQIAAQPAAVTATGAIAGIGPNLAIATPDAVWFLGYGLHGVRRLRAGSGGTLVSNDQLAFVLDRGLRERARFEVARPGMEWLDAVLVDDRYAIVLSARRTVARTESNQITVFDGMTGAVHQVLPYHVRDPQLAYEPSTRLLVASGGVTSQLVRFDPATHTFGAPIRIASAIATNRIVVTDPALADGIAALQLDTVADGVLVGEIADVDLVPGALVMPRASYRVPGELVTVDRAGRLYVHRAEDRGDVVVYTRGVAGARLPGVAALTLRPNADGSRIAVLDPPRLMMVSGAGEVQWTAAHWSGSDVAWTATGELLVQSPSAVASVDLATGALAERRCGWGFGLASQPLAVTAGGPSVCDAPR